MIIDLKDRTFLFTGQRNPVSDALNDAVVANGATAAIAGAAPDLLVASLPLLPDASADIDALLDGLQMHAEAMALRASGRILVLASAIAVMPMRRHPEFSQRTAGAIAAVRSLAMRHGKSVAINAVAVGAIGEPEVAGDSAMLSHVPLGRPGTLNEAVGTALFFLDPRNSYTTGQVLVVDGGWSVGYGRNF